MAVTRQFTPQKVSVWDLRGSEFSEAFELFPGVLVKDSAGDLDNVRSVLWSGKPSTSKQIQVFLVKLSAINKNPTISPRTVFWHGVVKFFNERLQKINSLRTRQRTKIREQCISAIFNLTGIMPRQGPPMTPQNPARASYLIFN